MSQIFSLFCSQRFCDFISESNINSGQDILVLISHIAYLKACTINQTDASHLESSFRNEAFKHALEEVNALAKMLVSTATA